MILTDREIRIAIERKQVIVEPPPPVDSFSSTAIDLTLHQNGRIFKDAVAHGINIDPCAAEYDFHGTAEILTEAVNLQPGYALPPRKLLLAWTDESITIPTTSRLAARVEGKSSLARIGVGIHITAPTIHAGFSGHLQLEIVNHGPTAVVLKSGMSICQLIFETTLGTPEKGYQGQFSGQQAE